MVSGGYTVSIFQPQLESWDGTTMNMTGAVSLHAADAKEPDFGALKVSATVFIDKVERTVHFSDIKINSAVFPAAKPETKDAYVKVLTPLIQDQVKSMSLDRIEAQLGIVKAETKAASVPLENPTPAFIFASKPAILVSVQGDPTLKPTGSDGVERVINTQAFLAKDSGGNYYLHLWDGYVTAKSLDGPWTVAASVPNGVSAATDAAVKAKLVDLLGSRPDPDTKKTLSLKTDPIPDIHVATVPTELIQYSGPANWTPLQSTNLLYVSNTGANVFMNMDDSQIYVLVSGRWFKAAATTGPWSYVAPKDLPKDFAKIPLSSVKENVLASVPGTDQAKQAIIATMIPQMAKVDREKAKLPALKFDGVPDIKPITGTDLKRVVNCSVPVIQDKSGKWYAIYNAVWFVSPDIGGPWVVATEVPAAIYSIPASSSVHYVTYVKIYSSTDKFVWVGYTPGYYGAVVSADGVVVYGTGYVYPTFIGTTTYIPAPVTYGYNATMAWTPWAGWAFGFAAGWALASDYHYWSTPPCCPCWGPYSSWCAYDYHGGYYGAAAWGCGGWACTSGNMYAHWGSTSAVYREGAGFNAYTGNGGAYQYGHAYNSATGTMACGARGAVGNVYTGNYAAHSGGTAYNPYSGKEVNAGRSEVGNAYNGNHAYTAHVASYNPETGKTNFAGGVQTKEGGLYDVNGNTFATHDGNVYRPSSEQGGYEHYNSSGSWDHVNDSNLNSSLNDNHASQVQGADRSNSWSNHGWQDSGARSFGGGDRSFGGGDRSFGGGDRGGFGGRSFGGGGGGFHGFRR
ncbi:MAG: hypothetical protein K1X53_00135 [Candidatus Sumerlaeaceae bacterium]|nr:hypothetical protein [Candidatus Sumerlaeaceae bacterium]